MNDFIVRFLVLFITILLSIRPLIVLMNSTVDGGLDMGMAIVCFLCWCGYIVLMMSVGIGMLLLFFPLFFVFAIFFTSFGNTIRHLRISHIDKEQYDRFAHLLDEDPLNVNARLNLSKTLHRMGRLSEAIEQMDWIITNYPALASQYRPTLTIWRKEDSRKNRQSQIFCDECHEANLSDSMVCIHCGAELSANWRRWIHFNSMGDLARLWVILSVCVIGIGLLFHFFIAFPAIIFSSLLVAASIGILFLGGKSK